ncbi:MAG: tetratricopeptide repeat protein [Candidatus Cloacimonetes bacterium]|nr:tetratricopeptide repeat protein [Candidatus Cloacimonadota bacterium]
MRIKFWAIILLTVLCITLTASASEDLMFAVGLYEDGNYSLAEQELVRYLAAYPASDFAAEASYLLGDVYLNQGKYQQAIEIFFELRKSPPASIPFSDVLFGLGQSYYHLANYAEAKKIFAELIKKYPSNDQSSSFYYFLGTCQMETGELAKAETNLKNALVAEDRMTVRLKLVQLYLSNSNWTAAEEILLSAADLYRGDENFNYALILFHNQNIIRAQYEKVLNIGDDLIDSSSEYYDQYRMLKGIAHFELGDFQQAVACLQDLTFTKARYYYALSLIKLDDPAQAKTILLALASSDQPEIAANSHFYLADLAESPEKKEKLLQEFLNDYPDNIFAAEALYLLGNCQFDQNKFASAADNISRSLTAGLSREYQQRAYYLKAEAKYLDNNQDAALQAFSEYLEKYPSGQFADEAYFKRGMCYYTAGDFAHAKAEFELVIYNFESSDKQGMSNFYLGETALLAKDFETARKYYSIALNQKSDKNLVWLRIAQSWQQNKNYPKAAAALENVDSSSIYAIDKLVLLGDIRFAQKDYDNALQAYDQAVNLETANTRKESIQAKQAWTYYQKGEYDIASDIYKRLSIRTDNPAAYTFQSATAMFSAQQYDTALKQYRMFVENFPDSPNALTAQVGIGDCLYNLGKFAAAGSQYRSLITQITNPEMHQSIMDGWKWSTEQAGKDFLAEMNNYLAGDVQINFRFMVDEYKAKYLFHLHKYQEVSDLVDEMKGKYIYPMQDLEYLKARSYKNLEMWDAADDFYARLFTVYKDANLQYEWADITLIQGRIQTTVSKLQYAAEKVKKPEYILRLLQIEVQYDQPEFEDDYPLYIDMLSGIDHEKALLERTKWLLNKQKIADADQIIMQLKESTTEEIKAEAQYLSGFSLYQQQNYSAAVPELLRVRHLFPYLRDIRHRSEVLAFKAYLKMDKKQEAKNLLDNIRDDLDADSVNELEKLLAGE